MEILEINKEELRKIAKEEFPELTDVEIDNLIEDFIKTKIPELKKSL